MEAAINWILGQLVSGWWLVTVVINWTVANPAAAAFWAGVWATALNYLVKLTPTHVDDSLLDGIIRAISEGLNRAKDKNTQQPGR